MKWKNFKTIFVKNILYFLFFGVTVALVTTYVNYNMEVHKIHKKLSQDSTFISIDIKSHIKKYLDRVEDSINSVNTNQLFVNYLINSTKQSKETLQQLFVNSMKNNNNFFQFRFIDTDGNEIIRVDKEKNSKNIFIVEENNLQNKSDRYYFIETVHNKVDNYWYSKFDLNIERGAIEKPLKPTIRVSRNVFHKGKYYGILIVNVEMKSLLSYIGRNTTFDTYLIDNDGYFILHPKKERNWTRYLNNKQTIFTEFPDLTEEEFNSNSFVSNGFLYNLDDFFKNSEHIKLGLIVKDEYLKDIKKDNFEFALSIGMIIILISVPIGIIVSIPTSKLYMNINTLYKENLRHIDTIDKHVATMVVNLNKNITDVSTALCKISGYSKEELLGQTPSVFKSGNMDVQVYKELWNKISQRYVWSGELENKTKSGEPYWVDVTILPNLDEKNNLISFTSIMEDITDKKLIEKISQTDKLTQLYNRVKLDDSLDYEINRYIRYKDIFSVILIDIDYFKSVNDTYGHLVGDNVLVELSNQLKIHCRNTDILGRWGGEEFMIICTDTNIKGAIELAEHLRKTVDTFEFEIVKHKTISIGVSEVTNADNIETLIKRVDENLYKAKKEGRNRVISDS